MYAIIRKGNGEYYTSMVFGCYCEVTETDEYKKYLQEIHNRFYIIFDENKELLIKKYIFPKENKYLDPQIILLNDSRDNWVCDDEDFGCVSELASIDFFTDDFQVPKDILKSCLAMDNSIIYDEHIDIKNNRDIENFYCATGYLHDAYIERIEQTTDSLYIMFDGVWGCKVEMWFSGNVEYSNEGRNPDFYDPYWSDCTMIFENDYIYLIDSENMTVAKILEGDCWFKGKKVKYHIIPN